MNIQVLGTGCLNCARLEANVKQAVQETGIDATVTKVSDVNEIVAHGIMSTPALVVDGRVVSYGIVPSVEEMKRLIAAEEKPKADESGCHGCSCGGHC